MGRSRWVGSSPRRALRVKGDMRTEGTTASRTAAGACGESPTTTRSIGGVNDAGRCGLPARIRDERDNEGTSMSANEGAMKPCP